MTPHCDLHTHSLASDGVLSPAALVDEAAQAGVRVLALTDHDTVAGVAEARQRASELDLELIPGIEISVNEQQGRRQMHILGLGIDPESEAVLERTREMHELRQRRAARMVDLLNEAGVELDFEQVLQVAANASCGRPHVAKALVETGVCSHINEAFSRFLGRGKPAYLPSVGPVAQEAIRWIHEAGGIASLAHPTRSLGLDAPLGLNGFVSELVGVGLDGLEIQHPSQKPKERKRLRRLAREHNLVETGGSDFHGSERPPLRLGRGRGEIALGPEIHAKLCERLSERRGRSELTPPEPMGTLARPQ